MEAKTKDLWVFIETEEDGSPKKVGLELLNPGRRLADKQGGKLVAVVIGDNIAASVEAAGSHGADRCRRTGIQVLFYRRLCKCALPYG